MTESKKCLYCWITFDKLSSTSKKVWVTRKYCSHDCVHEHEKQEKLKAWAIPKSCIICWKAFYRKCKWNKQWENQKHCWQKCSGISFGRVWAKYNKAKAIPMPLTKVCIMCNKEYTRNWRWTKDRRNSIVCWRACANNYNKTQPYKKSRRFWVIRNWKKWNNRRLIVFARDDYTCQMCGLKDPMIMQVDHIIEKSIDPTLSNSLDNLQTLCPNCHTRKTNLFKSKSNITNRHYIMLSKVKLLQENPEFLKELIKKN